MNVSANGHGNIGNDYYGPTISAEPFQDTYVEGESVYEIEIGYTCASNSSGNVTAYLNGVFIELLDAWKAEDGPVVVMAGDYYLDIDGLPVGTHNYTFVNQYATGESASATTIITVTPKSEPTSSAETSSLSNQFSATKTSQRALYLLVLESKPFMFLMSAIAALLGGMALAYLVERFRKI